jgi:hypothetical protein
MQSCQVKTPEREKAQVNGDEGERRRIRLEPLDGSVRAHNPKVGGSNPPPATIESPGQSRSSGRFFPFGPGAYPIGNREEGTVLVKFRFMLSTVAPAPA